MKVFNRGVDINVSNEDALKVNGTKIIDKDGKIYGDIHAAAGSIGTAELADDAVTADKLADNAVVTANIVAKNVTGDKIANKGVDTAQIADGAIEALQINADAVETAKILNANVTLAKLAAGITPSHIVKFFVSGITGTALEGLAVGDLIVTITAASEASVAVCAAEDTLPGDAAETDYIIVFRAVS